MLPLRHEKRWRLAGIVLLVVVLVAAVMPALSLWQQYSTLPLLDKWLHISTFLFLTLWFTGQYERRSYWRLALGLIAFGTLIEIGQSMLSYRTAEWMDLVADGVGIAAGLLVALAGVGGWSLRIEQWLAGESAGIE